jgi:hypothetical protein
VKWVKEHFHEGWLFLAGFWALAVYSVIQGHAVWFTAFNFVAGVVYYWWARRSWQRHRQDKALREAAILPPYWDKRYDIPPGAYEPIETPTDE